MTAPWIMPTEATRSLIMVIIFISMPGDKNYTDVTIHWYRHGLRLHDNPALLEGIKNCGAFYPVYILDGKVAGTETAGYNRWRFLLESLEDLDRSFKKLGGQLYVFKGDPVDIFRKLFSEWNVTKLTFEQDPEPIWRERDELVKNLCIQRKVTCIEMVSHTLWDPRLISKKNGGVPPVTYMLFNQVARSLGPPSHPMPLPDFQGISLPAKDNNGFRVPSLEHLGIKPECDEQNKRVNKWEGGETVALTLFETRRKIEEKAFEANKVLPNQSQVDLIGPPVSMSAHLRFGCLSIRTLYWGIVDTYKKVKSEEAPLSATAQLMWREYFYTMSLNNIKYNKVEGNPICLNVPWHTDDEKLNRWLYGQTGFPWIDAIMNQLRHEGWIHQVARHATACFLTRGDLWLSWEKGLEVFYKYLLDADWSVCAGNWMWVASSAFEDVLQCPKCFCPVRYGIRMDPKGAYIRRYVPVLKEMPLKYLFSPWTAPLLVQENAQCIVGKDYPKPIVDHYKAAKENKKYMDEVKELLKREKDKPHCAPCNQAEVGQFAFLPEYEDPQIKCLASETCHALKIDTD
ncbi:cryptochrome-1-like [Liolophura sinensis]|uniref:cryptochrome-1-like n=1 Tax=Liolophura sinensis TaxID=3198878 RepID=UPI00315819E2